MKNIKTIILVVILFLAVNVKADNMCDSKELSRLKELAKKVEFDYGYNIKGNDIEFYIHAVNLNEDLKVLIIEDYFNDDYKEFKGENEATLNGFKSGEKVIITIKGFVPNPCSGVTVYSKTIRLPHYNIFYNRSKCEGNEDFKYCKELIDVNISKEEYDRQFELYLKDKEEKNKKNNKDKEESNTQLYIMIGAGVVILGLSSALIINVVKRRKKNKL